MSFKVYDPSTKKWVVQASNIASSTYVLDAGGNYDSADVEGVLKEIAEMHMYAAGMQNLIPWNTY